MKYFIINLSHRTDRWNKMLKQMESQQIQTFQRFDAIKPSWFSMEKEIERLCPFFFKNLLERKVSFSLGTVGAFLSHEKLLKEHEYETKPFVILEDDVEITVPSIQSELESIFQKIPSFDILVLFPNKRFHVIREYKECVYETTPIVFGAYAYCINPRVIPKLLRHLKVISNPFDIQMQEIVQRHYIQYYLTKTFMITTPTIITRDSDISLWKKVKTSLEHFTPSLFRTEKNNSSDPPFIYCPFPTILHLPSIFEYHPSKEIKITNQTDKLLLHICHCHSNHQDVSLSFQLNEEQENALFST